MIGSTGRDWRVVLLAVMAGAGALLCIGLTTAITGYSFLESRVGPTTTTAPRVEDSAADFVLLGGMALAAGVLIATLLAAVQALRGRAERGFVSRPMPWWAVVLCLSAWLGASALVQLLHDRGTGTWAVPFLHLLAIAAPIYLLTRTAIAGIRGGSRLRLWGSFCTGMLLGTSLAAVFEIVLLLMAVATAGVYLIANPEQVVTLQRLVFRLSLVGSPEEALPVLGPMLTSPIALLLALAAVAVAAPVMEEFAKSVPLWAMHDRIRTGAQGFWAGALSGAGFALFEGIMVSSDAGAGLAFILVLRAGSSLMHIFASGLAGWGIGGFRGTGKVTRLLTGYIAAMGVHALWNAVVVAIGYGGIRTTYGTVQPDLFGLGLSIVGTAMLVGMIVALPVALVGINLRLRTTEGPSPAEASSEASQSAAGIENTSEVT
jgi:hypothetical protein